ncbi:MAG TPA: sugar phosphate isomerase/epimerase [Candidatus Hydrogenedentes bacterium]|nr:sugar phosphate isomerase/epimerase [Candidatus Hydrogenedentota bacterium]
MEVNRRHFMKCALAAAPAAGILSGAASTDQEKGSAPPLCVFSKHLQFLNYKELAATCRELGLDGVDLTVRPGGHVLPENVARDLPDAVEAIRAEGLDVPMITTRFLSGNDAGVRETLTAAKAQGINYFRIGSHRYDANGAIPAQLEKVVEDVRGLTRIAEEIGMTAGYHNHSGMFYVGAPLWDLHRVYEAVGSERMGANFDTGHATVEGAYGNWQITARLLAPWVRMMAVKDFVFEGRQPRWVPLGEGVVDTAAMLGIFREHAGFRGPVSMHFEYKIRSNDAMIEEVRKAAAYMRKEVYPKAGYDF